MEPVDPQAVSVVVAGSTRPGDPGRPAFDLRDGLAALRRHLPGAELILSTWRGEAPAGEPGLLAIEQDMPPAMIDANGAPNNLIRQIAAVRAGLAAATRPHVLKLRPDLVLRGRALLHLADTPAARAHPLRLFGRRITLTSLVTRDPVRHPMLFHPSDMVQFGCARDIRDYWDHPPRPEPWHRRRAGPRRNPVGTVAGYTDMRLVPEQALCLAWLQRHGLAVDLAHPCDGDAGRLDLWEAVLAANFHVVPWHDSDVAFPARFDAFRAGHAATLLDAPTIARLEAALDDPHARRGRAVRYHLNRYPLCLARRAWYISTAAIVLFSLHPGLARHARALWRRWTGWRQG